VGVAKYVHLNDTLQPENQQECVFYTVADFWSFVASVTHGRRETYMYAHNWSFDWPVLNGFASMTSLGYRLLSIVDASPPVILRYSNGREKITVIDTLNYYRTSLADIGIAVGLPKLSIDIDNVTVEQLTPYCRRDVEIVELAVIRLIQYLSENNISRLTHTVSSIALSAFIRRFCRYDIMIDGDVKRVKIARSSYFGGRTECFRLGAYSGKFFLIDVNSMYPYVMRNHDYPVKAFAVWKRVRVSDLGVLCEKYCITALVKVSTNIPVFPVKIGGKTCFPIGEYLTYLSTPEILYGIENDLISEVVCVVAYQKARIFEDYVDYFYSQRQRHKQAGNETYQEFDKKLLNTLYGKFGQIGLEWVETDLQARGQCGRWTIIDNVAGKSVSYMEIEGVVYESKRESESRDSSPSIAAHVTAHARMHLQYTMDFVGSGHYYYCDTDSLLLDRHGYEKIKDSLNKTTLGAWSLKGQYDKIDIRGLKDYKFGDEERIKGINRKAVRVSNGLYSQLQFSSLKGAIRSGDTTHPTIRRIEKRLKRKYDKGRVSQEGLVTPLVIGIGD
jgi:hypothetical protein